MSKYKTISCDYHVLKLNDDGDIIEQIYADDPMYNNAMDTMANDFNEMHLEKYIDDGDALEFLGYPVKEKIKSITMERTDRLDEHGTPYMKITVEAFPRALRLTKKVCEFLDDYLTAQFCDGWGESFFYPYNSFKMPNGQRLAIE